MSFTYNPLWKLLIDKGMKKEDLRQAIGISSSTIAKMSKGEYVSMEVIDRICAYFNCKIEDVIEYVGEEK
ncbi:helix-turn-helix transcriptional regulator [Brevibacillus agri]|uniref:helix-turn-helix domain-containing protein n=1 Tax=Brevibacillus agri TaxID=51101 RepID=UPI0025B6DFB7|nr:helix-turn-helix transcriptional regulator [Brevibacillus agri]MDN4093552.1 helix-turn-helix transcriptional regulator [Brevibacillus agri]